MSRRTQLCRALAVLALLPVLQGCIAVVAAVAAVGYVQYDRNEFEEQISLPFQTTWEASLAAVDALGYPGERTEDLTTTECTLEVGDLWLRVEKLPFGKSKLRVRVGTFVRENNSRRTQLVVEQIHRELGIEPPVFDEAEETGPTVVTEDNVPGDGGVDGAERPTGPPFAD